jgi:hypothetical protein
VCDEALALQFLGTARDTLAYPMLLSFPKVCVCVFFFSCARHARVPYAPQLYKGVCYMRIREHTCAYVSRQRTLCSSASQRCVLYVYNVCVDTYICIYNSCIDTKSIYTYIYTYIYIYIYIYILNVYLYVYIYKYNTASLRWPATSTLSAHVCARMLTYAGVCSKVARDEYAVCSRMRTYAHVCSRMLAYAQRWPPTSTLSAHVCARMLTYAVVWYRKACATAWLSIRASKRARSRSAALVSSCFS